MPDIANGMTMPHPILSASRFARYRALALMAALSLVVFSMVSSAETPSAETRSIDTKTGKINVETVAEGLDHPWGMAFLPGGRVLVTERSGDLRILDAGGSLSAPLEGVPDVVAKGQGGLLDVALDPNFADNKLVYLSYAEAGDGGAGTAVARGRLEGKGLEAVQVIFRQTPKVSGRNHFGGRLAFAPDGTLFVTLGDRFAFEPAQDLSSHLGKVVRINPDGSVPPDNPFIGEKDAQPEIWSLGHRNVESAAIHPETGKLWTLEFGPKGGDELNNPVPGGNYGWPLVSWGKHYSGKDIPNPPTRPEFLDAVRHWTPVISPSGTTFYSGDAIPGWTGDLLVGGLSSEGIVRLSLDGETVSGEERIPMGVRIRDVQQGPDGTVYALTDEADGKVLRLTSEGPSGLQ